MTPLERRYRLLLRCYPNDDGLRDEILSTLLDTAQPGQHVPTLRATMSLLGNGFVARLGRSGRAEFAQAARSLRIAAAAMMTSVVVLVAGVNLAGTWAEPTPTLFVPLWAAVGAVPIMYALSSRTLRRGRWMVISGALIVVALGPNAMLAQRTLLTAVVVLAAMLTLGHHSAATPPVARYAAVLTGIAIGGFGAVNVASRVGHLPASERQHEAVLLWSAIDVRISAGLWTPIVLIVVVLIAGYRPSIGLAFAALMIPTTLIVAVVGNHHPEAPAVFVLQVALWALAVGLCATASALHRARPLPLAKQSTHARMRRFPDRTPQGE